MAGYGNISRNENEYTDEQWELVKAGFHRSHGSVYRWLNGLHTVDRTTPRTHRYNPVSRAVAWWLRL